MSAKHPLVFPELWVAWEGWEGKWNGYVLMLAGYIDFPRPFRPRLPFYYIHIRARCWICRCRYFRLARPSPGKTVIDWLSPVKYSFVLRLSIVFP